eukprot:scaffold10169_cov86-Skeletonema_dohrnii-CCMP3373.AAC.3
MALNAAMFASRNNSASLGYRATTYGDPPNSDTTQTSRTCKDYTNISSLTQCYRVRFKPPSS